MSEKALLEWQEKTLHDLVEIPSHDPDGERTITQYIQRRIERSDAQYHGIPIGDGRDVLVAELGCPIADAQCSVLLHAHVDTVYGTKRKKRRKGPLDRRPHPRPPWVDPWPGRYKLQIEGDEARGSGVYDMKGGVMVLMNVAHYLKPPDGTHVDVAFLPDEEKESKGQQKLEQWILDHRRGYHACLSPEVEPRSAADSDERQRIVIGRRGALKVAGAIELSEEAMGHSAEGGLEAIGALALLQGGLRSAFKTQLQRHTLLGAEELRPAVVYADGRDEMTSEDEGEFGFKVFLVPKEAHKGRTGSEILDAEMERFSALIEGVCTRLQWTRKVKVDTWKDYPYTSYPPYCLGESHPIIQCVKNTAQRVAHPEMSAICVGGSSNADANLFHHFFQEHYRELGLKEPTVVLDIPYRGYGAHSMYERASLSSIARVREIMWRLLERDLPAQIQKMSQ